jgi:hypothetical protein
MLVIVCESNRLSTKKDNEKWFISVPRRADRKVCEETGPRYRSYCTVLRSSPANSVLFLLVAATHVCLASSSRGVHSPLRHSIARSERDLHPPPHSRTNETRKSSHRAILHCVHRNRQVNPLLRAQELLASTELPLIDIALATGFADQSHFSRRFHQMTGVPPRAFRLQHR